jgi:DcuC family C4-dicarboxylate transporter
VSWLKAAVPLVPLGLLFLTAPPLQLIEVPRGWLLDSGEPPAVFDSRLIGAAMLVGVIVAAVTDRRAAPGVSGAFFEGAGYALTHIISIIVAAACFGKGVQLIGLDRPIGHLIAAWPGMCLPASGFVPLGFGVVSGSGMAATQSLYGFFAQPALGLGIAPEHVGAVVSLGAAAGRTMSPVAAVVLMCASLTFTNPTELVRRVAPPLLIGMVAVVIAAMVMVASGGA